MAIYADRAHAGRALASELVARVTTADAVFGIPRGGVVVAAPVAQALRVPLRAVAVRKLGAPRHEEFAVGAIAERVRVVDPAAIARGWVTAEELVDVEGRERTELRRRIATYASPGPGAPPRRVVVVDDGIATGATATAACRSLRAAGVREIVLAVPVAPRSWSPEAGLIEAYVCPHRIRDLWAVGAHYDDFRQTTDAEVVALLDASSGAAAG